MRDVVASLLDDGLREDALVFRNQAGEIKDFAQKRHPAVRVRVMHRNLGRRVVPRRHRCARAELLRRGSRQARGGWARNGRSGEHMVLRGARLRRCRCRRGRSTCSSAQLTA